jgi:flagellar protein FlaG
MDGVANVARQQQSQVGTQETQGRATQSVQQQVQQPKQVDIVKEIQKEATSTKIDTKEQVQDLVKQLNDAMAPVSTNLKFGVDRDDVFYVSVIESETSKMIRRFPAEQARDFLPKMQEVTGILFDSKG